MPDYNFSKNFFLNNISGTFNINSSGNNTINNTNVSTSLVNNNLNFSSFDFLSSKGIKSNFFFNAKNSNSMSDESVKYKNSPQSELMSAYYYNASFPFEKKTSDMLNTLTPKLSLRLSPHDMKNHKDTNRRISINNVFSNSRLNLSDSFEAGESLTLGIDFKKEKVDELNTITEIEEYFDFKLAAVLRLNKEEDIPIISTINEKTSNIFGLLSFKPNKNIILDYDFSLTNDLDTFEYNSIGAKYSSDNFSTKFNYLEETLSLIHI